MADMMVFRGAQAAAIVEKMHAHYYDLDMKRAEKILEEPRAQAAQDQKRLLKQQP